MSTIPPAGRRLLVLLLAAAGCTADAPAPAPSLADLLATHEIVDLSYAYDEETVYWPTADGFELERGPAGVTEAGFYYEANAFRSAEHGGTHLDAPIHFAEGRQTVDAIPLDRLVGPAVRIDVSQQALADRDYQVTVADIEAWEAAHGPLPEGAIVLLDTGYAQFWPDRVRYMGTDARGPEAVADLHFPGLHPDAARWLVGERDIRAVGLDTPSIDTGQSALFEAHQILFEANVPAFENVAALSGLPARGFVVAALPMKIRGGSGGPLRIVAFVPDA